MNIAPVVFRLTHKRAPYMRCVVHKFKSGATHKTFFVDVTFFPCFVSLVQNICITCACIKNAEKVDEYVKERFGLE